MEARALAQRPQAEEYRLAALIVASGILLIAMIAAVPASAEEVSDIPGAFVDVGIGAAEMRMGGAAVAGSQGASAVFWNPAGLALADRGKEFAIAYCDQMGLVPYSAACGLWRLSDDYAEFDAEVRFDVGHIAADESPDCRSGEVLQGAIKPHQCPAFGKQCTPRTPLGATMVSNEGTCAAYYNYGRRAAEADA